MIDLSLEPGEEIRFPVGPDHSLAEAQEIRPIRSLEDVMSFEFVRLWAHFSGVRPYDEEVLAALQEQAPEEVRRATVLGQRFRTFDEFIKVHDFGELLQITLLDFIIPAGATVVLSQRMNHIRAKKVLITGTLRSEGHLAIEAVELGG